MDEGAGVLARVRHLEELRAQLSGAAAAQAKAEEAHRLAEEALRQAQATSLELSQALANLRGRAEAARNTASAAAEKLASCRRELESVERQRAEAEAAVASARPNVESFEARVKELDAALDAGKKKQEALSEELAPLRREAHRVSDSLAEAKLAQATLRSAPPTPSASAMPASATWRPLPLRARRPVWPCARRRSPPPASSRCSPSSTS